MRRTGVYFPNRGNFQRYRQYKDIETFKLRKKLKKYIYRLSFILFYVISTSYVYNPKPHIIVGNWGLIGNQKLNKILLKDGIANSIEILAFSSDEITSSFTLIENEKKEDQRITFGFKIFEPFDEFKNPVILLKIYVIISQGLSFLFYN